MLVEFKVQNFRSIQSEQTFSLVASKDDAHPDNLIGCGKFSLVKAAAIYGPNASGKSTLINALKAMQEFVVSSATHMNVGDPIKAAIPFRLDKESTGKPSRFEVTVLVEGTTYFYGLSVTPERVCEETLDVRKERGRITRWFERRYNSATQQTFWKINGPLRPDAALLQAKTRDNGLLLSRGAEFNIRPLIPLFLWFRGQCVILDLSGNTETLSQSTAGMIKENSELQTIVVQLIRDADFGINDLNVVDEPYFKSFVDSSGNKVTKPAAIDSDTFRRMFNQFMVETYHKNHETGEMVRFSLDEDESNGTRRFFSLAGPVLHALNSASLLIIDELDCSMHPLLTRKWIELFQSWNADARGAQLIFTTHDSSTMDSYLFRRDQIWLTEKSNHGATNLFSLYDFSVTRPRKFEALEKNYLTGRYGGIPNFGLALECLEVR